jgi:V8-like Glu-specific endopeptidase
MITLEHQDLQQLVSLLQGQELMQDLSSRREALRFAGLGRLLPLLDLAGAPFVASSKVIGFLSTYGRLTYENEALGLFLNGIKAAVGVEQQDIIDRLLMKYQMMEPIALPRKLDDWRSPKTANTVVEKIFGESTLRPIAFLARGLEIARSVAYISVTEGSRRWSGTGFLISPNLIMTNQHVVSSREQAEGVLARFNYEENFKGEAQSTTEYRAKPKGAFHANEGLDYAVVELLGDPGRSWGWLPLQPRDVKTGERVNIIQHPSGRPKQISMHNNLVEYVGGNVLQYVTSTSPGSSGSPVLNDGWEVVGLHHAGGSIVEPTTQKSYDRNEGILSQRILADLPSEIRQCLEQPRVPQP